MSGLWRWLTLSASLWMFLIATSGCAGGGSTGTGLGHLIDADGVIHFASGEPAAGITVTARTAHSDDLAVSDEDGAYHLSISVAPDGSAEFFFDADALDIHWEHTVEHIPENVARFTVTWTVLEDRRVTPVKTEFFDSTGAEITVVPE